MVKIEVVSTEDDVIIALNKVMEEKSKTAIAERNRFVVGLSGGSLRELLCRGFPKLKTDWSKWVFIFCDERVVPFGDDECTYKFYKDHLIPAVSITEDQFVLINPDLPTQEAAVDYEQKLRKLFPNVSLPQIDVLLQGVGPDGHTCSLFPGHPLLDVTDKWVAPIEDSPKPPPCRITLTYPVIDNALCNIFALSGTKKANIVKTLLKDKVDLPASRIKSTEVLWILDQGAASLL